MQFTKRLLDLKSSDIKSIARLCGSRTSGTKTVLVAELAAAVAQRTQGLNRAYRLVSIDLGIKNIGICQVQIPPFSNSFEKPVVERWFHHSLPQPLSHRFPEFSDEVIRFSKLFTADAFVLEKQRSRTAGSHAIPNDVLRVNVMEGMMFTALRLQNPSEDTMLQSISPRDVVEFWRSASSETTEVPETSEKLTQSQAYRLAKRTRSALVSSWLQNPEESPLIFQHESHIPPKVPPKLDDINDALVQAYTWILWRRNCTQLLANVESGADLFKGMK